MGLSGGFVLVLVWVLWFFFELWSVWLVWLVWGRFGVSWVFVRVWGAGGALVVVCVPRDRFVLNVGFEVMVAPRVVLVLRVTC
jgi:hypothetical protein